MAVTVREVMNREMFGLRPADPAGLALDGILALGITGAPVVDEAGRPLGMISLRDLVERRGGATVGERMSAPAVVIAAEAPLTSAGRVLGETGLHRLVVGGDDGRVEGVVSALDVLRGLLGLPAVHPAPFPHLDRETGIVWTDDAPFELDRLDGAPDDPGLLALVHGGAGLPERVVWAEEAVNVCTRLAEMLSTPQTDEPLLAWWLARGGLRFRTAAVADAAKRSQALQSLLREARLPAVPSWV